LTLPTFGLLMMAAFVVAFVVLQAELKRRKLRASPDTIIAYMAIAGIVGAKLWHVVDTPADRLTVQALQHAVDLPSFLAGVGVLRGAATYLVNFFVWFREGFAWFGGFVAGIATLLLLGRKYRINMLTMLDLASPAVALGYAVGRIGCLISGDGDYGQPTSLPWGMAFPNGLVPTTDTCRQWGWPASCHVHPTPIYEFIAGVAIFWYLWRRGRRAIQHPLAPGAITGEFLVLSGLARFLVEFIRINPRVIWGMSNAQFFGLLSAVAGFLLLVIVRRRFRKVDPVHKVLDHVMQHGNDPKPEYHRPTPECPNPELWSMFDTMTAEVEVLDFLKCLMTTVKPNLVVETGTFLAVSTLYMAEGLKQNGSGRIITCEPDPEVFAKARENIEASGLKKWIDCRCQSSLDLKVTGTIDVLFCDSLPELREPEVRHFLPQINPNGLILMHDASSHLKTVREAALRLEQEGLISVVLLPTPRGLVIAQRKEGRK
jgi:prolipoprotein diacylglyceryltransferase/predicted O-methyltransferase YrrM